MRWKTVVLGAVAFLAAHVVVRALWIRAAADHTDVAWFLNAGRGVAITAAVLFVAAALRAGAAAGDFHAAVRQGADFTAGAVVAMVITLFAVGPGTLFPIAMAIGAVVVGVSSVAGALAGWACRALTR